MLRRKFLLRSLSVIVVPLAKAMGPPVVVSNTYSFTVGDVDEMWTFLGAPVMPGWYRITSVGDNSTLCARIK